ncbi:MAG TPA: hypothetical protein VF173_26040 [Thermoanaerobaculia bacterium]|nr:hypothetical protein [Thermoanaerobaculia bacterium]
MTRKAHALIDEITQHVKQGLEERLAAYDDGGRPLEGIGSPRDLARRMLEIVPLASRWDDLLGPFYGTGQVAKILGGVSRQAIADRRERRTLLGLKTSDGVMIYPTFQFDDRNQVLPGLAEILQTFRHSAVDDWTLASWLAAPSKSLQGNSVVQWLRTGGDLEPALVLARDAARRFAQ